MEQIRTDESRKLNPEPNGGTTLDTELELNTEVVGRSVSGIKII